MNWFMTPNELEQVFQDRCVAPLVRNQGILNKSISSDTAFMFSFGFGVGRGEYILTDVVGIVNKDEILGEVGPDSEFTWQLTLHFQMLQGCMP